MEHVAFTAGLPKVELHLHLEGTLEPGPERELADRDGVAAAHHPDAGVLRTRADFRDLATAYFHRAAARGVRHAEVLLSPQAHVARGVALEDVVLGHHDAAVAAGRELGLSAGLVLLLASDLPLASAEAILEAATGLREQVVGIGLDAGGRGGLPAGFAPLLRPGARRGVPAHHASGGSTAVSSPCANCSRTSGWTVSTSPGTPGDLAGDLRSLDLVRERGTGLVCCPLANAAATGGPGGAPVAGLLRRGVRVAVASGDPVRSGAYVTEHLLALTRDVELTFDELIQLQRNAIEISWASEEAREGFLAELDAYEALVAPDL